MSRRRTGAALTAGLAAAVLTACTGDAPAADPVGDTSTDASASTAPAEPVEDPLEFDVLGGRSILSCFPDGPRRMLHLDQVRTSRAVTLTGLRGGGDATVVRRSWVAPLPDDAVGRSGNLDLDAGGLRPDDIDEWSDRVPLEGAELVPGQDYTWFVRTTTLPDRSYDDFELQWDDGAVSGSSAYHHRGRTRRGGC